MSSSRTKNKGQQSRPRTPCVLHHKSSIAGSREQLPVGYRSEDRGEMESGNRTWALDVTDDRTGGVVHELDTDLGNTSTGTCKLSELLSSK